MTETNNSGTNGGDELIRYQDTYWQQATQHLYEPDRDGELTTAIVFAIATAEDVPATEVKSPPLYDVVDVAAIEDAFFGPGTDEGPRDGTGSIEFRYTDYLVKVRSDGWIQVYEPTESEQV